MAGAARLNFLWIYGEDLYPNIACYGTPAVQTPNLDRLAAEGVRYENAFVTNPVCSPSRSAIITGTYQTSLGAHQHRSEREAPLPDGVRLITDCFRDAGYFTCNSPGPAFDRHGKTDFNFHVDDPFDGKDWSERAEGQPFYAQCNLPDTHRDFRRDPERPVDPDAVELPRYYPDDPLTRADWAHYLESVQVVDRKVGQILDRLDEEGLAENTVVFFISDHGRAHVRDKQFLYDGGIRVPLIVRGPGIEPGVVSNDLVSGIDFAPTTLSLAGLPIPDHMEGQVFLGPDATTRDEVIAARDRCDGTVDRIRAVRTHRYKYIRNYHADRPYLQFNAYKKLQYPVLALMESMHARGELTPEQALFMAETRPAEELYDLAADPHEVCNLADDPTCAAVLADLRGRLTAWIAHTGDNGEQSEDPAVVAYWQEHMANNWVEAMGKRGLDPDITPDDYLRWWQEAYGIA
jgi:N-sulfoglucosamine sulfohydrolase